MFWIYLRSIVVASQIQFHSSGVSWLSRLVAAERFKSILLAHFSDVVYSLMLDKLIIDVNILISLSVGSTNYRSSANYCYIDKQIRYPRALACQIWSLTVESSYRSKG